MPLSIVVGGQFGGEGKGAITAFLVVKDKHSILVKTGGPNSTHSFGKESWLARVRMVPCGANLGPSTLVYPAGCLIHVETLFSEIRQLNFVGKIVVDPKAGIVEAVHIKQQQEDSFYNNAGSTLTGTGAASAARAQRRLRLARDEPKLAEFLGDAQMFLAKAIDTGKGVLIEGSQSFGLSNYHGEYPYTTSRDTSVGSFLGQVGLGIEYVDEVILVVKCFPTRNRVGSGPLPFELSEEFVVAHADSLEEHGGGTYGEVGPRRRIACFDFEIARRAIIANTPNYIAVTGLDRLASLQSEKSINEHYGTPADFLSSLEKELGLPVGVQGWGPYIENIIDTRMDKAGTRK